MAIPAWLTHTFAAAMAVVLAFCIMRLVVTRRRGSAEGRDVDLSHALMAVAMIGMLVPSWNVIPDAAWRVVFAVFLAWFVVQSVRDYLAVRRTKGSSGAPPRVPHHMLHAVMAFAMLDMYWIGMPVASGGGGTAGMPMGSAAATSANPLLTMLIIIALLGFALWEIDAVAGAPPAGHGGAPLTVSAGTGGNGALVLAPRLKVASYALMCVTMAFTLVVVL